MYKPAVSADEASRSVLKNVVDTFFAGSPEHTVAALLDITAPDLNSAQLDRLSAMIDEARQEGR